MRVVRASDARVRRFMYPSPRVVSEEGGTMAVNRGRKKSAKQSAVEATDAVAATPHLHADGLPPFAADHRAGLLDFWAVYDAHYERVLQTTLDLAIAHSEFGPIVRGMTVEQQDEQNRRSRDLLRGAIVDGEWAPYIEDLRTQGALYAKLGVGFTGWYDVIRAFQRVLVPMLVESYGQTPDQLARTMPPMLKFIT